MNTNIELLKKLHGIAHAKQPRCPFGGESMAELYLPWMHVTLMRSVSASVNRNAVADFLPGLKNALCV